MCTCQFNNKKSVFERTQQRTLSQDTEPLIPENFIRRMGSGVAVLFKPSELAQVIHTAELMLRVPFH